MLKHHSFMSTEIRTDDDNAYLDRCWNANNEDVDVELKRVPVDIPPEELKRLLEENLLYQLIYFKRQEGENEKLHKPDDWEKDAENEKIEKPEETKKTEEICIPVDHALEKAMFQIETDTD